MPPHSLTDCERIKLWRYALRVAHQFANTRNTVGHWVDERAEPPTSESVSANCCCVASVVEVIFEMRAFSLWSITFIRFVSVWMFLLQSPHLSITFNSTDTLSLILWDKQDAPLVSQLRSSALYRYSNRNPPHRNVSSNISLIDISISEHSSYNSFIVSFIVLVAENVLIIVIFYFNLLFFLLEVILVKFLNKEIPELMGLHHNAYCVCFLLAYLFSLVENVVVGVNWGFK